MWILGKRKYISNTNKKETYRADQIRIRTNLSAGHVGDKATNLKMTEQQEKKGARPGQVLGAQDRDQAAPARARGGDGRVGGGGDRRQPEHVHGDQTYFWGFPVFFQFSIVYEYEETSGEREKYQSN